MTAGYLLSRILLQFRDEATLHDLSAIVSKGDELWLASDETTCVERLTRIDAATFGQHETFDLAELLEDINPEDGEMDIEGMDCGEGYLWVIGSHSTKRKGPRGDRMTDLTTVKSEQNRYLLVRIPVAKGTLHSSYKDRRVAYLERSDRSNLLLDALKQDEFLGAFLAPEIAIPGKDNGFDIEGLIYHDGRLWIGLRGPVLRGIAVLLEIEVEEGNPGRLRLKEIGKNGQLYRKHFVDLDGLGIRELCVNGNDLLILGGPTMDLDGTLRVFRLKHAFKLPDNSLSNSENGLKPLFDIPYRPGSDRAEGLTLFSGFNHTDCLMVLYDSPHPDRLLKKTAVLADLFTLE